MDLVSGRDLTDEDVRTAHLLIDQHQPCEPIQRKGRETIYCASAMHQTIAVAWPCDRYHWAERVILAEDRGEVAGVPSNVHRISA